MRVHLSLTAIIALSFLIVLAGCGRKEEAAKEEAVTIKVAFWGSPEEIGIITNTIKAWEKLHPEIKVRLEHTPHSGYISKILTRIAGGAGPDIICTEVDFFPSFWAKDVFLDLTDFIEEDEAFSIDDFFPEVVDRFTIDGRVYAIPRDTAPFACIFYNKHLFDEAGLPYPKDDWDWPDLLATAQKLTEVSNGRVTRYGFYAWAWENFLYSNGGRLVDDVKNPTRCLLDEPEAIEALEFYADLIHKDKVAPTPVALVNLGMGVQTMFATGRLAMFSSGIWETPILRKVKGFDWDVAMFPKGPRGIRGFGTGGSGYSILKTTKHPGEAWEVIKALSGRDGQIMLAETGLAQPALKAVAQGPHWAHSPKPPLNKGMLNEAVKYVTYSPFHPKWREIRELHINLEFDLIFNGEKRPKEVIGKLMPKVNELLRQ